jgi:hypothetical protein
MRHCAKVLHYAFLVPLVLLLGACTSVPDGTIAMIPPEPPSDYDYSKVIKKWRKSVRVYDQFQNRVEMNAVLFTEEMRQAYLARWKRLRGDGEARIASEFGGNLALFVSVYTPQEDFIRLDNQNLWTIRMTYGTEKLAPTTVLRLYEKPMYQSFFDFVDKWSAEYLVVFDVSATESSEPVALPEDIGAQFSSSLAYINLKWP